MKPQSGRVCRNPVKSGFYPDPSICRSGDDYYLVTSSFAYFPAVPIFHSKDLVNWRQIGHVLDRTSQVPLEGARTSEGIFAPTLRFHEGTFYLITTNVSGGGNFYVTSRNPAGPWSEPVWLPSAPGIDPTIFFDDDGTAWYLGTRPAPEGPAWPGNWEIWLQELDLAHGALVGEALGLWRGALKEAIWPEGPHLYRKGDYYYLMIAEGGTGSNHAVTMARSANLRGPYEGNPRNPILSHRHLGLNASITNVGHGDLVETPLGETWMAVLASRPCGGPFRNLGRETFLARAVWEDGWLTVAPDSGLIEEFFTAPALPWAPVPEESHCDHFEGPALGPQWVHLRNPSAENYVLNSNPASLTLTLSQAGLRALSSPTAVFRRQTDMSFLAETEFHFAPEGEGESAGLVIRQNEQFQIFAEKTQTAGASVLRIIAIENGNEKILASVPCPGDVLRLALEARGQSLAFRYKLPGSGWQVLSEGMDARLLSTDRAGGFVGTMLGLFAVANGIKSHNTARFTWFEYHGIHD